MPSSTNLYNLYKLFVEANRKPGILFPMKMEGKYEDVPIYLNPFSATSLVHPHHFDEFVSRFQISCG